jgi:transposase
MALRKRQGQEQPEFWIATQDIAAPPGHPFYEKLNELLDEAGFDAFVEELCAPYYAEKIGRPSIPPGVYFRMLFVGYFEGIDSQRGIAWRCADSLCLRQFLGVPLTEKTPVHMTLTNTRRRLPAHVHEAVFVKVLSIAAEKGLLKGQTLGVDATTLEANAALKSIVRKDTGEEYQEFLKRLALEDGQEEPTREALQRFDKKRKGKKLSNQEWESPTDPDSRIARMKDGRTRLAYKAEHAVDLESEFVVAATVYPADTGDADTLPASAAAAQVNLVRAGEDGGVREVVADKGYHKAATLAQCQAWAVRTYVAEPKPGGLRRWTDKPEASRAAVYGNRRRIRGARGKRLQRWRSERVERSFAHVCDTGGARRTWLRGLRAVRKRYLIQAAAHNLGLLMRKLFGIGKPRCLQGGLGSGCGLLFVLVVAVVRHVRQLRSSLELFLFAGASGAAARRSDCLCSAGAFALAA